jgi:hypothetical protein
MFSDRFGLAAAGKKSHRPSLGWRLTVSSGAAALTLCSGVALAQVYKCLGHDGRVTYADQPCRGAARVTELAIEPNVIETAADRVKEQAEAAADVARRSKTTVECERAVDELDRVRRSAASDSAASRSAYERVLQSCRSDTPPGRSSSAPRDPGVGPGAGARASDIGRPVEMPLPPGATDRGSR